MDRLKKYIDEANNHRSNAQFNMNKSKYLQEQLCTFVATFEELEPSTQLGKRESTHFSSSQEEGLQKPPKQHRALK